MATITRAELYAGRRRLKDEISTCEVAAAEAIVTPGEVERMRDMMRFHSGLKTRHLDSLAIYPSGLGYRATLLLKDTPLGMPGVIGAEGTYANPQEALDAGRALLAAAMLEILDFKARSRSGTAERARRFEFQDFFFAVPDEIVAIMSRKLPRRITEREREVVVAEATSALRSKLSGIGDDPVAWDGLPDAEQVDVLCSAARLLSLNINRIAE